MTLWYLHHGGQDILDRYLTAHPPTLAVEAGGGDTTLILARHASRLVSLEHLAKYAKMTRDRLAAADLTADLRLCPLVPLGTPAGTFPWYDTELPDDIDFALIDGPPLAVGRKAALFALWPHLTPDAEVWLDDAHRPHEKECLALWGAHLPITVEPIDGRLVCIRRHVT